MHRLTLRLSAMARALTAHRGHPERGDVPGWVLVTLMTAGLVTVIWGVAGNALVDVFTTAINGVTAP